MELEIHNYLSCSHKLHTNSGHWDSLVILDSSLQESGFVKRHSANSLQLNFDDISKPQPQKIEPSIELISHAIVYGIQSEKLIVCCRAGQSRSAATAFAIAYEKMGKQFACSLLNPKRHSPNVRILQIADEIIDRPGILNAFDDWQAVNRNVRLADYLDEIESECSDLENLGVRDRISACSNSN